MPQEYKISCNKPTQGKGRSLETTPLRQRRKTIDHGITSYGLEELIYWKWPYYRQSIDSAQSPLKSLFYIYRNKKNILKITWKHKEPWAPKETLDISNFQRIIPNLPSFFYWGWLASTSTIHRPCTPAFLDLFLWTKISILYIEKTFFLSIPSLLSTQVGSIT